jgi:hypothetical protein
MHLALYNDTIVFDQATKLVYIICWVHLDDDTTAVNSSSSSSNGSSSGAVSSSRDADALRAAYDAGKQRLQALVRQLSTPPPSFAPAQVDMALSQLPAPPGKSNMTKQQFLDAVLAAKEYILVRLVYVFEATRFLGGWNSGTAGWTSRLQQQQPVYLCICMLGHSLVTRLFRPHPYPSFNFHPPLAVW